MISISALFAYLPPLLWTRGNVVWEIKELEMTGRNSSFTPDVHHAGSELVTGRYITD
jgi:hypothetical protein